MEELLSLKWNNHKSSFIQVLAQLRIKDAYADVTLACEGKIYNAHKLVLSTCSDYFSNIFQSIDIKNPVIILKDIKCRELESLLDYMYLGEVNVSQMDLSSLLKTAECLQLKGLAVPDEKDKRKLEESSSSSRRKKLKHTNQPPLPSHTSDNNTVASTSNTSPTDSNIIYTEKSEIFIKDEVPDCEYMEAPKEEEFHSFSLDSDASSSINTDPHIGDNSTNKMLFEPEPGAHLWGDIHTKPDNSIDQSESPYPSNLEESFEMPLCSVQRNTTMSRPVAAYICLTCGKRFRKPIDLRRHERTHTGEKPYGCPHCYYWAALKSHIKRHMMTLHKDFSNTNIKLKENEI